MRRIILLIMICMIQFAISTEAKTVEGGVSTVETTGGNRVVDTQTKQPVANAKVSLPLLQYKTYTDENGSFQLGAAVKGKTVMSVEKDGYRPHSVTIDEKSFGDPIIVSIQKSNADDIKLSTQMMHLGDNNYSKNSANSGEFKLEAVGPFYSKSFTMATTALNKNNYLLIGSIIGIDTAMARAMGQNKVRNSFSSPPEVFFNGNKIAEIHLNGDGQKIRIPNNLIRPNMKNEITIKTGRNLMQSAYIDYDDIEIMNISVIAE